MAHPREHIAYIGRFSDPNYGRDEDGEVFVTLDDAVASLHHRHRFGHTVPTPVLYPFGERHEHLFPNVSNDAYIELWTLRWEHKIPVHDLPHVDYQPTLLEYLSATPGHVVWIGARGGVRVGYWGEFIDQRAERSRRAVVEAGSVVVR